jgi:hypothetical protein
VSGSDNRDLVAVREFPSAFVSPTRNGPPEEGADATAGSRRSEDLAERREIEHLA